MTRKVPTYILTFEYIYLQFLQPCTPIQNHIEIVFFGQNTSVFLSPTVLEFEII